MYNYSHVEVCARCGRYIVTPPVGQDYCECMNVEYRGEAGSIRTGYEWPQANRWKDAISGHYVSGKLGA